MTAALDLETFREYAVRWDKLQGFGLSSCSYVSEWTDGCSRIERLAIREQLLISRSLGCRFERLLMNALSCGKELSVS